MFPLNPDLKGTLCAGAACMHDADVLTQMTLRSARSIGVLALAVPMCLEHAQTFRNAGAELVSFDSGLWQ